MRSISILALVFLFLSVGQAKTLLVSDVDDTLKLANVLDLSSAASYSFDDKSRFLGMAELFTLIKKDNPDLSVYYVSRAPSWWMQGTHEQFLRNGKFPAGVYIPRTNLSMETHKLITIRSIMNSENPDKVIFFGDNGEKDAEVYEQIKSEYETKGVRFYQFIRLVYSSKDSEDAGVIPFADQVGFVTPVEVSFELKKAGLLAEESVVWTAENIASAILKQKKDYDVGTVAFPKFMRCNDFVWKWDDVGVYPNLPELKQRLEERCQK
ncbi:phosphatase domain-containing protein [Bdellovibrio svalbardensis]|uniref:DUF2183 domain-containing protein n=1 Tax=Bdellovibrio svalbardensis TaxID=2972972 RepID=A0ABT6DJH9_9BACT|nr:phosphatase domain-containing protein [Bdellovibrio svalbardensis]MDG0816647.1 DUF2183 domain-containing protein [Bdellovibrio svalbardensis]